MSRKKPYSKKCSLANCRIVKSRSATFPMIQIVKPLRGSLKYSAVPMIKDLKSLKKCAGNAASFVLRASALTVSAQTLVNLLNFVNSKIASQFPMLLRSSYDNNAQNFQNIVKTASQFSQNIVKAPLELSQNMVKIPSEFSHVIPTIGHSFGFVGTG